MLSRINQQLEDNFGRLEDRARYRIVWSDDEMEQRLGTYRDYVPGTNIFLREVTEVRTVPKYKQWAAGVYILERITKYDEFNHEGTVVEKLGYEPLYTFNKLGKENVPSFGACKYLIEVVIEGTKSPGTYIKYKDTNERERAEHKAQIDQIMLELFGNETDVTDALAHGEGVSVPSTYEKMH